MDFDFSFFLVAVTFVFGIIWGGYILMNRHRPTSDDAREPILVEYARSFFPVVFIVLILRSFIVEPFRIPSGSMMPTLLIGDFILVNKFIYGIRLPVLNTKVIGISEPEHGDIAVFRFPKDPSTDYIKRIIGLPGDHVVYQDKKLTINGTSASQVLLGTYAGEGKNSGMNGALELSETLDESIHSILVRDRQPTVNVDVVVPEGHYFVLGDNRDNSNDSRYWGMVPEENLVGKAFMIWMNWDWDNDGVAWERLGSLLK